MQENTEQPKTNAIPSHSDLRVRSFPVKLWAEITNVASHNDLSFGEMLVKIIKMGICHYPLQHRLTFVDKAPEITVHYLRKRIRADGFSGVITDEMLEAKKKTIQAYRQSRFEKMNLSGRKEL